MVEFLVPVALLTGGVACGIMLSTVIGIFPFMTRMPYQGYVSAVQFLWRRYDPAMPILNGVALVTCAAIAILAGPSAARSAFAVASALLVVLMVISVSKNVPINRYVFRLDPAAQPADWDQRDPRARWRWWNNLRTAIALAALLCSALGAGLLLAG
jgi:uncharacterized membrane protein